MGTATDPYQPAEGRYGLTRWALEQFTRFRSPISLLTKNSMIVRDLDVLTSLRDAAAVSICFSIPTVDMKIWRRTEPGTAHRGSGRRTRRPLPRFQPAAPCAGLRGYFLEFVGAEYPELLDGYRRLYGDKYAPKRYRARVDERVREIRESAGLAGRVRSPEGGGTSPQRQLALPLR